MLVAGVAHGRQLPGRAVDHRPVEAFVEQRPTEEDEAVGSNRHLAVYIALGSIGTIARMEMPDVSRTFERRIASRSIPDSFVPGYLSRKSLLFCET